MTGALFLPATFSEVLHLNSYFSWGKYLNENDRDWSLAEEGPWKIVIAPGRPVPNPRVAFLYIFLNNSSPSQIQQLINRTKISRTRYTKDIGYWLSQTGCLWFEQMQTADKAREQAQNWWIAICVNRVRKNTGRFTSVLAHSQHSNLNWFSLLEILCSWTILRVCYRQAVNRGLLFTGLLLYVIKDDELSLRRCNANGGVAKYWHAVVDYCGNPLLHSKTNLKFQLVNNSARKTKKMPSRSSSFEFKRKRGREGVGVNPLAPSLNSQCEWLGHIVCVTEAVWMGGC